MEQLQHLEQIEVEDPGYLWEAIAFFALHRYWFYLRVMLDFRWVDPHFHGDEVCAFLKELDDNDEDGLVLMPRGTGKTGLITCNMPAWWLARKPDGRTLIMNAEEGRGQRMARANANIITNNPMYQKAFTKLKRGDKWGEGGYFLAPLNQDDELAATTERQDPNLIGYGIGSNKTGSHINAGMCIDDLINEQMAKYPNEVKKAEAAFAEALNLIDPGTPLRICATRWTYHDYCGAIERGDLQGRRGPIRVLKLGITRRNPSTNKHEIICPLRKWTDRHGTEYEFGFTFESLEALKKANKGLFPALYYNEPVLEEDCLFNLPMIKRYKKLSDLPFQPGGIGRVLIETESQASAFLSTMRVMMRQENRRMPIESVTSKRTTKKERILSAHQAFIQNGKYNMREDHYQRDDNLGEELRTYDKGHDDCLDAHAYCIMACHDAGPDQPPQVVIAVDPAFSEEGYSDYTAIAVGCIYDGEYYELDTVRFQTQSTEVLARRIFQVYDKFDTLSFSDPAKNKRVMPGFSASRATRRRRGSRRGRYTDAHTLEVDLRGIIHPPPPEQNDD